MQMERVIKPPLTIWDSVGVNSRAPRRINTLSWLFIFSPFIIWVRVGPKALQKIFRRPVAWRKRSLPRRADAMKLALAERGVAISLA